MSTDKVPEWMGSWDLESEDGYHVAVYVNNLAPNLYSTAGISVVSAQALMRQFNLRIGDVAYIYYRREIANTYTPVEIWYLSNISVGFGSNVLILLWRGNGYSRVDNGSSTD